MTASPISYGVGLRGTLDLLALIDELGPRATGEIAVLGPERFGGAVFLEQGRVCWAAAPGLARRLTELLGARASLPPEEMESFFVACRAQNIPLGEHLVSRGVLRPGDLREALLQHTAESARRLCAASALASFSARSGKGYSPRFTFTSSELAVRIGATSLPAEASSLAPVLERSFGEGDWGVAFVRHAGSSAPEPVAARGHTPPAATSVRRLGQWGASSTDAAASFSGPAPLVSVARATEGRRTLVAFTLRSGVLVVGETGDLGLARMMNQRAARRRAGGDDGDL